jgi:cell division transport system permease protein
MRALRNMKGTLLPNITTIAIIGISMLIFSAFSLIAHNLTSFLKIWEEKIEVIAYLKKEIPLSEVEDLLRQVRNLEGVERVSYVSPFDAIAFMENKLGQQKNLLQGIRPDILPASFEIRIEKGYRTSLKVQEIAAALRRIPQFEEIQYGQEWLETFSAIVHILRITQWVLGGLLLIGIIFIVSNTLQLTISSRRMEVEIMHLVGASPAFIQIPFYLEGMFQGLIGTGLALLFLFFLYYKLILYKFFFLYLTPTMKEWVSGIPGTPISFLDWRTSAAILGVGAVLGLFGSFVASMRFLRYGGVASR